MFIVAIPVVWQTVENRRFGGRMEPSSHLYDGMSLGQKAKAVLTESFVMIARLFKREDAAARG